MERGRDSFFLPNKKEYKPTKGKKDFKENGSQEQSQKDFKTNKTRRQEQFNKNRPGLEDKQDDKKKPFDKKTYRLKKYSKKYKLEQWEEQRKKILLRNYYKEVKNEPSALSYKSKTFDGDATDGNDVGRFVRHPDLIAKQEQEEKSKIKAKKDPFFKAKEQFNKIKQDKLQKQQEQERSKEETKKKMQEYKKKKQERFKKLSKKNKKGQPMMTGRLELLLDKIQKGSN